MSATVIRYGWYTAMGWLLGTLILAAGCTTSNIDTALMPEPLPPAPQTVADVQKADTALASVPSEASAFEPLVPQDTASLAYPNINKQPVGETAQLSKADQELIRAQAKNAQQSVDISDESAAYAARLAKLKLLARTHAKLTQQQIEGQ